MHSKVIVFIIVFSLSSEFSECYGGIYQGFTPQGFPTVPPTGQNYQQTGGTNYICAPANTCINGASSTGPSVIDPRIVTNNGNGPSAQTAYCQNGLVPCYQVAGGAQCGTRYVSSVSTSDGPSTYGAHPWQAYIVNQTGYAGSGILIDNYHILTAAHKVYLSSFTPNSIQVYMGVYNPSTDLSNGQAQSSTVCQILIHPNFNSTTLMNDIAILRVSSPFALGYQNNVVAACLPSSGTSYVKNRCTVAGWGDTSFGLGNSPTNPQKQVEVPIVSYRRCYKSMSQPNVLGYNVDSYLDPNGELCAGGEPNRDACTQDGGAPLTCYNQNGQYVAVGMVIWGKGCAQPNVYGVYANLAYYTNWILGSLPLSC